MAEFPFLPLATDAYLGDTTHLTTIEHGAYLLLLMAAWRSPDCRLPDDDKLLSRYARLTAGQWARMRPILAAFWRIEGGFWMQRRLTDEWEAVRQKREKAKDAAGSRWLKNKKGRHADASPEQSERNANHNHNHIEDTDVSSPPVSPTPKSFALPDWVPEAEWLGFCEMRRRIKAPLTDRAKGGIIRELEKLAEDGHPPGRVLDQSTTNAWRGVFPLKDGTDERAMGRQQQPAMGYRRDPAWERFKQLGAEFAADPDGWGAQAIEGG